MQEIISLISEQTELCRSATDALKAVREALKHNSDGRGVTASVHKIEPLLTALDDVNKKIEDAVARVGAKNLYEAIMAQPDSADKDAALRLFADAEILQNQIKRDNALTRELLRKGKLFVDFHINVASQVTAEHTYGPPGTAENIKQGRKVFVADA